MRGRTFAVGMALAAALLAGAIGTAVPVPAQSNDDLNALNQQVAALINAAKFDDALPLSQRSIALTKAQHGENHPRYAIALNNLAGLLKATNRLTEAEPLYRGALAIFERSLGPDHPAVATNLNNLAVLLQETNRLGEAEPLYRRALTIDEKSLAPDNSSIARDLNNLAGLLQATNRLGEAETLYRRAVAVFEKSFGPHHPNVAAGLNNLAELLRQTNRLAEAEPLYRRALAIVEKSLGPNHPAIATNLSNLAGLLQATNRLGEAEPLYRRALDVFEKSLGPHHPNVATCLNNLAELLRDTNRLAEAEPLYRRALTIDERSLGPDHPSVAVRLNNLALLLQATNRLAEAEPLYRRALTIDERSLGPDHPAIARDLNNLAVLLQATNRLAEAEPLCRRALTIDERSLGPDHPTIARDLNNLAGLLRDTNRLAEAEPLYRRALAIWERSLGPSHPRVASGVNNLAGLLQATNRLGEAEPLFRRALAIDEKSLGPDHPSVATGLNNLAALLRDTNRLGEAEPLFRRALAIAEKSLGHHHPDVATGLNNLAGLLQITNRLDEAEPLYRRALAIDAKSLGPDHPDVAIELNNLAALRAELGDWAEAARLHGRAVPIMTGNHGGNGSRLDKAALVKNSYNLRASARAVHRAGVNSAAARTEGFALAQWALQTGAADALRQMTVRFARGGRPLAEVVRKRQDLVASHEGEDRRLLAAVGKGDARAAAELRTVVAGLEAQIGAIDRQLESEFPEYASLANPKPLAIAEVQRLLKVDEALLAFLDVPRPRFGRLPEETLAWAVTRTEARWISIPLGTSALAQRVARLRCGLDREGQWTWEGERWRAKSDRCRGLAPEGLADGAPLPFDVAVAHELYTALLAPFADLTSGKSLIIVPSGPLTSLPFHVLVTTSPSSRASPAPAPHPLPATGERHFPTWLALTKPITVLPSVGSLQALRKLPPSEAREPYLAFGNPLLDGGAPGRAALARAKQSCASSAAGEPRRVVTVDRRISDLAVLYRGGIDLAMLRSQAALPETADELCAVAGSLGALAQEADVVWLGARATEANLKALSRSGKLARSRVLHFATHGVLAGESEAILNTKAEPALILNPPKDGATPAELEEDNGLLTASEVAQLHLDADWVVLSACNTAAGAKGDAEALSGLARAFFYAKARALLVSHWYVSSEAAVKITTSAFAELSAHQEIGRAEALRRAMAHLIISGRSDEAQPEYWAPFVLVGEGAR